MDIEGSIWGTKPITARCICCGRKFNTSEAFVRMVIEGKAESLCPECDGDSDHEYPPEIENEDEERRHGI